MTLTTFTVSVVLLVLNAFFVAAEFAIISAKRHRLEDLAAEGSRAARAAVNSSRELSLMLAGAQLGITLCTLGLGAVAKPALASVLTPLIAWTTLAESVSYVLATIIAIAIVTFLHMVVGEMAPKSWAISHPETSAQLLAIPFRGFTWVTRPLLVFLNWVSNRLLRLIKVHAIDAQDSAQTPADLQLLLSQSHEHGMLQDEEHALLSGALRLEQETVASLAHPLGEAVTVPTDATIEQMTGVSRASGRSRAFLRATDGTLEGLAHVRDAILASARGDGARPVSTLSQPLVRVSGTRPLIDAVTELRSARAHLALVTDDAGTVTGFTSLEDILEEILGQFDDETDISALARAGRRPTSRGTAAPASPAAPAVPQGDSPGRRAEVGAG